VPTQTLAIVRSTGTDDAILIVTPSEDADPRLYTTQAMYVTSVPELMWLYPGVKVIGLSNHRVEIPDGAYFPGGNGMSIREVIAHIILVCVW
jgi:hypothetical protein